MAAAKTQQQKTKKRYMLFTFLMVMVAYAPDLDGIGYFMGVPYLHAFGHRGATHAPVFALLFGLLLGTLGPLFGLSYLRMTICSVMTMMTHGIVDGMTTGGHGIAFLWPFSDQRYFLPWQFIPVSKISLRIDRYQLKVFASEILIFSPLFIYTLWGWAKSKRRGLSSH